LSTGLWTEGTAWCESINGNTISWPAVRELLERTSSGTLDRFTKLEKVDESSLSDIRLARKAGGFAFEYWCLGGDIKDIRSLRQQFLTILGRNVFPSTRDDTSELTEERVLARIVTNAEFALRESNFGDIWGLSLSERENLLQRWASQIDAHTVADRAAEIHRRHQLAVRRRVELHQDTDSRALAKREPGRPCSESIANDNMKRTSSQ